MCQALSASHAMKSSNQSHEVNSIPLIFQRIKLKHRELQYLAKVTQLDKVSDGVNQPQAVGPKDPRC